MELIAGIVVAERFRLERELGRGGMGAVWAATHLITKKQVALKFMHAKSDELTARFVREAQAASAVRHPNVVEIHDVIPLPDGTPLMVMEMLVGEALAEKLEREGKLSPAETAQIMGPVISALGAAHAAGIVHRDLKPENIFLSRYSGMAIVPKVLDFGIAKLVAHNAGAQNESALTRTGSVLGTPYYMSPEQVFGEKDVDVRADIWALGVILYQCLCGQRPFEGENFGQLLKAVTSGRFEPIETHAPWVPPQLSDVVVRMLRDRQTRLSDLREVERALASVAGAPSGTSLPTAPAFAMTPSSGAFAVPHGWQASGGYPVAQASGGYPSAPSPNTPSPLLQSQPSGGYPAAQASGGYPSGPALTPSPMVRSQTLQMAPNLGDIPMRSSLGGKIAIALAAVAILTVLAGGATLAARVGGGSPARDGASATTTVATTPATATVAALATLTPSTAETPRDAVSDAGLAPAPHASSAGSVPPRSSSAGTAGVDSSPSARTATPNHAAGTGGLSTAVPF